MKPNQIELDSLRLTFRAPAESFVHTCAAPSTYEDLEDYIFRFFEHDGQIQIEGLSYAR